VISATLDGLITRSDRPLLVHRDSDRDDHEAVESDRDVLSSAGGS